MRLKERQGQLSRALDMREARAGRNPTFDAAGTKSVSWKAHLHLNRFRKVAIQNLDRLDLS